MRRPINIVLILSLLLSGFATHAFADEIEKRCGEEWEEGSNFYTRCVNEQRDAEAKLRNHTGAMRQLCEEKWDRNFIEMLACVEEQNRAQTFVESLPVGGVLAKCRSKGFGDFVVIAYCVDVNWEKILESGSMGDLSFLQETPSEVEPVARPPTTTGSYALRYIENLAGPYQVLPFAPNDRTGIQVMAEGEPQAVRLMHIEITKPELARAYLARMLKGGTIWLELDETDKSLGYVYINAADGEWGRNGMRLRQVNLMLVENGLAVPPAEPEHIRDLHFYESAALTASLRESSVWTGD